MKPRFIASALGAAALAVATPVLACPGGRLGFEDLDTDGNGVVTSEEFAAASQARVAKKFARLDANSDGVITKDEMEAARQAFREWHSRHTPGEPPPEL